MNVFLGSFKKIEHYYLLLALVIREPIKMSLNKLKLRRYRKRTSNWWIVKQLNIELLAIRGFLLIPYPTNPIFIYPHL